MRVSKQDAASEQIDRAIHSFFAGFTASAVTLAGAAESSLPEPEDPDGSMFHLMKTAGAKRGLSGKEVVTLINEVRDWLKHHNKDLPEIDIEEFHAVTMILRAYTKLTSVFGEGSVTPAMRDFEEWFRRSYQCWLDPRS